MRSIVRISIAAAALGGATLLAATPAQAHGASHDASPGHRVHVVKPGQSIQAAVDAAHAGDTILLKSGSYAGGILITKNNLTIRGTGRHTVLTPGATNQCVTPPATGSGICILGSAGHPVSGVTITKLTVRGFPTNGVFGLFTDRMTVTKVRAEDNVGYGITQFDSTRGAFIGNWVSGSTAEAGLYVGDIADAHGTVVADNHSSRNALGLLVRHARNVKVTDNSFADNCTGIALVDDGQPGGQGNTLLRDNWINANNRFCPARVEDGEEEVPPLQGTGIVILGGDHNTVTANKVTNNRGAQAFSGGIVLLPGIPPMTGGPGRPAAFNKITFNLVVGNSPADLIDHSGSDTNVFRHNRCRTSEPAGLCPCATEA